MSCNFCLFSIFLFQNHINMFLKILQKGIIHMYFVSCPLRHSKLKNDISFYNVNVVVDLRKDILGGTITNHLVKNHSELDLIF
jgi:hypothetical protein